MEHQPRARRARRSDRAADRRDRRIEWHFRRYHRLKEQLVDDVIQSAIGLAGQRCSALRMLYLPNESADTLIPTLGGALNALTVGDPSDPATDVGPVIEEAARSALERPVARLRKEAKVLFEKDVSALAGKGAFFSPFTAEVPTPDFLEREVFGPILHVYRYDPANLAAVAGKLAARRYASRSASTAGSSGSRTRCARWCRRTTSM